MLDLIDRLDRWGRTVPDRLAHVSGGRTLTYGALARQSDIIAVYLHEALPDSHAPVAIYGHKEPEMLIAFMGAIKAGHPYIPLDSTTPPQRIERVLSISGAPLMLTPDRVADLVATTTGSVPQSAYLPQPDDPFYIIFTSGSTGEPKGVVITHGCLESYLDWMLDEQIFAEQRETFLNQAPFSFDLSVMDLYGSLATGGTLFSLSQAEITNPAQLYQTLAHSEVTVWVSTPSFAQLCLAERTFTAARLSHVRKFLFCGETLTPEVATALLDRFPQAQVWNMYGPTEATVATTSIRIVPAVLGRYHALPVGYPKPDGRVLVVDEEGQPVAEGERGEIVIAGPNVSPGYLNRPDLTAKAFFAMDGRRAYRTGDWGHYQDGLLFCEGRSDHQIKLHGHRIELGDVEIHLQALPGVRDAIVVPKRKDGQADWLAAFVILNEPPNGSEFEAGRLLRQRLAEQLPAYMLPRHFYFLPSFPMTANGKADRQQLAQMLP